MIHELLMRLAVPALALLAAVLPLPDLAEAACLSAQKTRAAVAAGEAVSLAAALRRAGIKGEAVSAVLCGSPGNYVYRVQVLGPDGNLQQIDVPA